MKSAPSLMRFQLMNILPRFLIPAALCVLFSALPLPAQDKPVPNEDHPAVKVVRDYMKYMLAQDWEHSSALVEEQSMAALRDDYLKRMKRPGMLTLDEEKEIIEKFKVKRLEDIEKIDPRIFYTQYHQMLKERTDVPAEVLQTVRDSMQLRILGVAPESDTLTHVLVRTKHNNGRVQVENLELVSLLKRGDKWMVGLNEQVPKVTPLKDLQKDAVPGTSSGNTSGTPAASGEKTPASQEHKAPKKTPPSKKSGRS